jgi:3-(3-hydroxy-phenyl)propionate hydroxylase
VIFDVGIVGYGPIGALLTTLLARSGFSVAALERDAAPYALPRAGHFDGEIMRILQNAGIADELSPRLTVGVGMKFLAADGSILVDWPRPQAIGPQDWHASYRFHQPELEQHLRAAFARLSPHPARLRCEVFALEQDAETVDVRYEDLSRGRLEHVRCRYVIGCDGGRSTVRRFMGAEMEDLGIHDRWLVVDVLTHAPVPGLENATLQICDPARPTTVARASGLRRRWEFKIMPGDDLSTIDRADNVWAMLAPWIRPDQGVLERAVVYTFHSTISRPWRNGRMLLAGDAAHQMPPFLGQGLCSGARDAMNLAWKLASVLRGDADAGLLDSYEAERAPHVRAYIREAIRLGGIVQMTDPVAVAARDRRMAKEPEFLQSITPRLGPGLAGDAPHPVGSLGPQPRLPSGERMDDLVGPRFCLLIEAALFKAVASDVRADLLAAGVVVLPDAGCAWLANEGIGAALLRPDRYVLAVARTAVEVATFLPLLASIRSPTPVA